MKWNKNRKQEKNETFVQTTINKEKKNKNYVFALFYCSANFMHIEEKA